jgi:hypothetical protein
MKKYIIGLDLGQAQDSTALCLLEKMGEEKPFRYECQHLERLPLGTRYPAIVEFVGKLMETPELKEQSTLVIDATGVGRPVVDMFVQAGMWPDAVTITGGDTATSEGMNHRVPKRVLVSTLQVLLQSERLQIAPNQYRDILVQELLNFQVTVTEAANDTYGGRSGTHDDMVLAVALATWYGENRYPIEWKVW